MAGQTTAVWPAHHPRNHHLPSHKLALVSGRGVHFWVQRSRSWSHRQLNNFYACLHIAHASNLMENTYEFPPFCKNAPLGIMKKKRIIGPKEMAIGNSIKNCNHHISIELIGIENQLGFFETLDTLKPSAKAMKSLVSEVWIMLCIPYYSDYYECDIYHQLATHCHQLMMKWTPS